MDAPRIDTLEKIEQKWTNCVTCKIGVWATRKCFHTGSKKPTFLFVGEGPGVSEDVLGEPFVGPAGRLLKKALMEAGFLSSEWALTNLIACRPTDERKGPNRAPYHMEVANCAERLEETIKVLAPKVVVACGNVPYTFLQPNRGALKIYHPSYILRNGGVGSEMYKEYVKFLRTLRKAYYGSRSN